ncbi:hypothetical protein E2127_26110 [Escherichia coli]|nr:hypothetical protein E2127_26110 [Escherichia coli]
MMLLSGQIVVASLGVPYGRTQVTPQQSALKAASHKASQKIVARDQRSDDRFVCLTASFSNVSMPFRRVRFTRTATPE